MLAEAETRQVQDQVKTFCNCRQKTTWLSVNMCLFVSGLIES